MARVNEPDMIIADGTNTAAPLTLSGTQYSRPLRCGAGSRVSFHLEWTGTPTTAVTFWSTNKPDRERTDSTDADWVQETAPTHAGTGGAAGKSMNHVSDLGCELIRIKLVTSSGSGTMKGWGKVSS